MKIKRDWRCIMVLERLKPYVLIILVCFIQAGFNIISKVCLEKGMSRYGLVAYGYAFATVTTAVLALFFERKNESKLTLPTCLNILLLSLLGVLCTILLYAGIENTPAAFTAAMVNLIPPMTFLLAIFCRMEKLDLLKLNGQAKIGGTTIAFGGAALMTLYKGITVLSFHNHQTYKHTASKELSDKNLIKGSLLLVLHSLAAAVFCILQTATAKNNPAPMSLTTWNSLAGIVLSTTAAVIIDHKASSWKLAWDFTLVAPLYSRILIIGMSIYIQTLVMQSKGPVFVTAFRPLTTVIVAIMGLLILGEALHIGGVMGAVMIIFGLYAILWGKEDEEKKIQLRPVRCDQEIEMKAEP